MKRKYKFRSLRGSLKLMAIIGLAMAPMQVRADDDLDGDGTANVVDLDIDNDGTVNTLDDNIDGGIALTGPYAGQYIGDDVDDDSPLEDDTDGDQLDDDSLGENDIDGDSREDDNSSETDIDGDDRSDDDANETDIDGDSRQDDDDEEGLNDDDIDGDGLQDDDVNENDIDGDDLDDSSDSDIDGDDLGNSGNTDDDTDGDGLSNELDDDSDGDSTENSQDSDDDNDGQSDEDDDDHYGDDDEQETQANLTASSAAPSGSTALVEYQKLSTGKISLLVKAEGLVAGSYNIIVNGNNIGPIALTTDDDDTEGEANFETNPNAGEQSLPFDPAGLAIEIEKDGINYFSGIVPTAPGGDDDDGDDD